jgi:hypothetical protein
VSEREGLGAPGPSDHGDYHYDVVTHHRSGREHVVQYTSEDPLEAGAVLRLEGRYWLIESIDDSRARAQAARYRMTLRHPDGREEVGAFRRFRPGSPGLGHSLATIEDGQAANWQVVDQRVAHDENGGPYLELVAERDFSEVEELSDHELEHAFAQREEEELPEGAAAAFARAEAAGLSVELVALEPGEEPDWEEAERYIDALILEEIEDDLFQLCGVDVGHDPQDTWLSTVKERLLEDLQQFRADVEVDHDQIEEWSFRGARIFASAGSFDDEANPLSGHGWLSRLVDSSASAAAGFRRIQKARLELLEE